MLKQFNDGMSRTLNTSLLYECLKVTKSEKVVRAQTILHVATLPLRNVERLTRKGPELFGRSLWWNKEDKYGQIIRTTVIFLFPNHNNKFRGPQFSSAEEAFDGLKRVQ